LILDQFGNPLEIQNSTFSKPDQWLIDWIREGSTTHSGVAVNESTCLRSSTVFCCVRNIADDMAKYPLELYRRLKPRGKEKADSDPLYTLLHDEPNPEMSSFSFRQVLTKDLLLAGNGYAEIIKTKRGKVLELWPLDPKDITVRRNPGINQPLFYEYRPTGESTRTIDAEDMFHLKALGDGLVGWSVIRLARESIGIALAQDQYNAAGMGNDVSPAGVLSFEGDMTEQGLKRRREEFEEQHKGPRNRRRMIMSGGSNGKITWTPFDITPEDQMFVERLQHSVEDICRWFRMPPHKVQHLLRATFSNIDAQNLEYITDCLRTYVAIWEQEIVRKLIPQAQRRELFAEFDLRDLMRGDNAARTAYYTAMWNIGSFSQNDIRERENENPIPNGDHYYLNGAYVPDELAMLGPPAWRESDEEDDENGSDDDTDEQDDDENGEIEDEARPKPTPGEDGPLGSLVGAYLPVFAAEMKRLLKTEQDKVTRAAKRSGFADWAAKFYATQPKFISDTLLPTVWAFATSVMGGKPTEIMSRVIFEEVIATGHRMVQRSKDEMKKPEAVSAWVDVRADQEAKEIMGNLVRAMGLAFKEEDETTEVPNQ
jgi:HK97 family phage portal protein